jgi:hypothetical protein
MNITDENFSPWEYQSITDEMRQRLTIYTPRSLASKLGVSRAAVLAACKSGELRHKRVNSRVIKIESKQAAKWWIGLSR